MGIIIVLHFDKLIWSWVKSNNAGVVDSCDCIHLFEWFYTSIDNNEKCWLILTQSAVAWLVCVLQTIDVIVVYSIEKEVWWLALANTSKYRTENLWVREQQQQQLQNNTVGTASQPASPGTEWVWWQRLTSPTVLAATPAATQRVRVLSPTPTLCSL